MTSAEIYALPMDIGGWRMLPDGNEVKLGNGVTSASLNEYFRSLFPERSEFTKWVTPARMSPNFDGGTPLHYAMGAVLASPEAEVSDQQCDVGLHVLRLGHRPEWYGLCRADHQFIPLRVAVKREDICFAGLPTMDGKIRVRRLEVLE